MSSCTIPVGIVRRLHLLGGGQGIDNKAVGSALLRRNHGGHDKHSQLPLRPFLALARLPWFCPQSLMSPPLAGPRHHGRILRASSRTNASGSAPRSALTRSSSTRERIVPEAWRVERSDVRYPRTDSPTEHVSVRPLATPTPRAPAPGSARPPACSTPLWARCLGTARPHSLPERSM